MGLEIEEEIKSIARTLNKQIQDAAAVSHNEAEFRSKASRMIEEFATKMRLTIPVREEYTLVNGRADAVYNRLVIEYEAPGSLRPDNRHRVNQHAIEQVKGYVGGLVRRERHRPERLAGVVLDGSYFIFIRSKEGSWHVDPPVRVDDHSTEHFLRLLASLSTELALIPENLVRDFGENMPVSRKAASTFYNALLKTPNPKAKALFEQWSLQFSEVCNYAEVSKLDVQSFARAFGIREQRPEPFPLFFSIHTYYATFIKLLALQIVHYYAMPKLGTDLRQAATFKSEQLKAYLQKMEQGGIFRELGIANLLEGDFFGWYLDIWDEAIYQALKEIVASLANYSLVTLDVDPEQTRDLLKKLYQNLMPRALRHNLGEYYTPDWLAERLLDMLEAGRFKGDPNRRLLDPACGSGTFLVIAIRKIRQYAREKMLPESEVLEKILANVVGFDLNPLAVISARTNYLLALGDLLQHRKGEVNIPVYLCDSIMTPSESEDLFGQGVLKFNTAVGPFAVPKSLVYAQYIDMLANFLEEAVRLELSGEQFVSMLIEKLPLNPEQDGRDISVVVELYEKLLRLQRQGINGIWARILKNAFAPLFAGKFDYIAGNPPWVNWESLPENYRSQMIPLYEGVYQLFPHVGFRRRHGSAKVDISTLMTYVSADKYLEKNGKLGFLITQSVLKTDAGKGFRRFLLPNDIPIQAIHVDDMVELNPFEGASNRTSVVILQKGRPTKYPMPSYLYWKKIAKGKSIAFDASLEGVMNMTQRKQFVAEPVNERDLTSPWITGRPRALKTVKKVMGQSDYKAHAGVCTWANGVYWVDIVARRPDGLVVVSNITEGAKCKVENVQAAIESDLLYPLLRGRDVRRWKAEASAWIVVPQDPNDPKHGCSENLLRTYFPKTYLYLKRFEPVLSKRPGYLKYLGREPFYALYDIKAYTFAPYKVVWREQCSSLMVASVGIFDSKCVIPDHKLMLVDCGIEQEAHYLCAVLNSSPARFTAVSYAIMIQMDPHLLENIRIPKFDPKNKFHFRLAELSQSAHDATQSDNQDKLRAIETEIDELAAEIWGLRSQELKDIQDSLRELE